MLVVCTYMKLILRMVAYCEVEFLSCYKIICIPMFWFSPCHLTCIMINAKFEVWVVDLRGFVIYELFLFEVSVYSWLDCYMLISPYLWSLVCIRVLWIKCCGLDWMRKEVVTNILNGLFVVFSQGGERCAKVVRLKICSKGWWLRELLLKGSLWF